MGFFSKIKKKAVAARQTVTRTLTKTSAGKALSKNVSAVAHATEAKINDAGRFIKENPRTSIVAVAAIGAAVVYGPAIVAAVKASSATSAAATGASGAAKGKGFISNLFGKSKAVVDKVDKAKERLDAYPAMQQAVKAKDVYNKTTASITRARSLSVNKQAQGVRPAQNANSIELMYGETTSPQLTTPANSRSGLGSFAKSSAVGVAGGANSCAAFAGESGIVYLSTFFALWGLTAVYYYAKRFKKL